MMFCDKKKLQIGEGSSLSCKSKECDCDKLEVFFFVLFLKWDGEINQLREANFFLKTWK